MIKKINKFIKMDLINISIFRDFIIKYLNLPSKRRITIVSFDIFIYLLNNNDKYYKEHKNINKETHNNILKIVNEIKEYKYEKNIYINIEKIRNFIIYYYNTPKKKRITIVSYDLFISNYFGINFNLDKHKKINIETKNTIIDIISLLKKDEEKIIEIKQKKKIKKRNFIKFDLSDEEKDLKELII